MTAPDPSDEVQYAHSLVTLPRDLQLCILAHCGTADLAAVAVTCSRLRSVAQMDELWRSAADRAVSWKPALAGRHRAIIAHPRWLRQTSTAPPAPDRQAPAAAVQPESGAAHWPGADGGEWLLTRAGSRLRLQRIQLRHTELGVPEACLLFYQDALQLWLDQGQPNAASAEVALHSHFALRNRFHVQYLLTSFRIAATFVVDSIALQLRALLMSDSRMPVNESPAVGYAWSLVQAAAATYNSWVRSVASATGGVPLNRLVDPLGDLSIGRGGAAAFRSQVLLAYPVRRELQRGAADIICRLYSQPECGYMRAHAPAADLVLVQRLAMECSESEAARQAHRAPVAVEQLLRGLAAMAQLLDAFHVTDELRSYWWSRDGAHSLSRFQRQFGFVLRAGQDVSVHVPNFLPSSSALSKAAPGVCLHV